MTVAEALRDTTTGLGAARAALAAERDARLAAAAAIAAAEGITLEAAVARVWTTARYEA